MVKMKNKKNKKGWIMIVESVIAVMILFSFVFIAMAKQAQETRALQEKPNFYDVANTLAKKTQSNYAIRNKVFENPPDINGIKIDLQRETRKINARLNVSVNITGIGGICSFALPEKEVYSASAIIASSLSEYDPKKICIFVWQE